MEYFHACTISESIESGIIYFDDNVYHNNYVLHYGIINFFEILKTVMFPNRKERDY